MQPPSVIKLLWKLKLKFLVLNYSKTILFDLTCRNKLRSRTRHTWYQVLTGEKELPGLKFGIDTLIFVSTLVSTWDKPETTNPILALFLTMFYPVKTSLPTYYHSLFLIHWWQVGLSFYQGLNLPVNR
jgi:hypothetical protein